MIRSHFRRSGISLIEVILSVGLIAILFGGVYLSLFSILDVVANSELRGAGMRVLNREIEIVRDLPYDQVGTQGGVPSGVLTQQKTVTSTVATFLVNAFVRNIDDPFDGILGGVPNDTAPADYKLVQVQVSCPTCAHFAPLFFTTTVAPKNLESAGTNGSLFINVFDANGQAVSGTLVHVVNASVTPAINLTDVTNQNGLLQLVGVPTSTQRYEISVSKSGYSSDQTYLPGAPLNPNPATPHATVALQSLTSISFLIDRVSTLNVLTSNATCSAIPNMPFSLQGAKKIGTSPDVYKFSTSSVTDASGRKSFGTIEGDTYTFTSTSSSYDVVGTISLSPLIIDPNTTHDFRFVLAPADPNSLLVTVEDALTGSPIQSSTVTLSKSGFSGTMTTARSSSTHTNWSGNNYDSKDSVETDAALGSITITGSPGSYSTSTTAWLISNTIDIGSSTGQYFTLSWNPTSQAGAGSAKFQIASNNDQATWNFVGPDGTSGTYYTTNSAIGSGHLNQRYLRYKVYLQTNDENFTPQVDDVTVVFYGVCVPPGQVLFTNLSTGTYTVTVNAPGYTVASSSIAVGSGWQEITVPVTP